MDSSAPATVASAGNDVTGLLIAWSNGNQDALDTLVPLIYCELRRIARRYMRRDSGGQTLETTALVHEAYLRFVNQKEMTWRNRAHFFAVSAQSMRHILVDMARGRRAQRRGSGAHTVSLDSVLVFSPERATALVALDDALTALAQLDKRKSQIVEMRFFGGLTLEETAEVLNISPETVTREWKRAKAWLQSELPGKPAET
ncbi:MAG TPA: ECF-type sigma factor [Bryobacteraceae bacterium]|jgi:RNA polymerase sigma factor (TIGR02999 family)|nr:ECF-type sigma factor [Bryobacteraceae bacterium]